MAEMNMPSKNELPCNSNRSKNEVEQETKASLDAPARTRKVKENKAKSFIVDIGGTFVNHLVVDIILPQFKLFIHDTLSDTVDSIFGSGKKNAKYVSYNKYSSNTSSARERDRDYTKAYRSRSLQYDEIIYETRAEAQKVLTMLRDDIEETGVATVSDLFDHSRLRGPATGPDYGWTNLDNAYVSRDGADYIINLPKARPI